MNNRCMPNGTYWWCERGEKLFPARLDYGKKRMTDLRIAMISYIRVFFPCRKACVTIFSWKERTDEGITGQISIVCTARGKDRKSVMRADRS